MTRRAASLALLLIASSGAPALAASATELFYERSLMTAAGARCKLFEPSIAAALTASRRQARGAALRAGVDPGVLDSAEARARDRAAASSCGSPDLAVAAERVRKGFAGYSQVEIMSFPGELSAWRADRGNAGGAGEWRLLQTAQAPDGLLAFGIAGPSGGESLTAVAGWAGALAASGARLVVRDTAKASRPYLDPRRRDLASRTPPRPVTRSFLASARIPAGARLLPAGANVGAAFRFPAAAADALDELDPREAVVLELVYPTRSGERVEQVPLEVGDFAAGRAFLIARP